MSNNILQGLRSGPVLPAEGVRPLGSVVSGTCHDDVWLTAHNSYASDSLGTTHKAICGRHMQPITTSHSTSSSKSAVPILDPKGLDALKRLQIRAQHAEVDLWGLLWSADAVGWEDCISKSFAAGMGVQLEESTVQYQVRNADGSIADMEVDPLFPGTERSVVRLINCWWDAKGGKPSTKEAKVAHAAAKASCRALPTRLRINHIMLHFWQEKLLDALVEIHKQMQQNKEAGLPNWFHPGSLTSGGRFSNTSACSRAVQAAYGMLACDCHDKTGGRQAECFRWLWTCTGVGGVLEEFEPPVWTLGLAGLFGDFQDAQSTGFHMIDWHCKAAADSFKVLRARDIHSYIPSLYLLQAQPSSNGVENDKGSNSDASSADEYNSKLASGSSSASNQSAAGSSEIAATPAAAVHPYMLSHAKPSKATRAQVLLKLSHLSGYDQRHSLQKDALQSGIPLELTAKLAGHSVDEAKRYAANSCYELSDSNAMSIKLINAEFTGVDPVPLPLAAGSALAGVPVHLELFRNPNMSQSPAAAVRSVSQPKLAAVLSSSGFKNSFSVMQGFLDSFNSNLLGD